MVYKFLYDKEYDILAIYNSNRNVEESVEVSENIVLDLDKDERVNGIEIMDASEFLGAFNSEINKEFLSQIDDASLDYKSFRNQWIILVNLKSKGKQFVQPMPPLRKSEYVSPLILSSEWLNIGILIIEEFLRRGWK